MGRASHAQRPLVSVVPSQATMLKASYEASSAQVSEIPQICPFSTLHCHLLASWLPQKTKAEGLQVQQQQAMQRSPSYLLSPAAPDLARPSSFSG